MGAVIFLIVILTVLTVALFAVGLSFFGILSLALSVFIVGMAIHAKNTVDRAEEEKRMIERQREAREKQRLANMSEQERRRAFIAQQRRLMSDSLRYDVMKRDGFRCKLCGATAKDGVKLHVDHIKPVSRGGKTEMSNLRTLCERCNLGKGAKQE